MLSFYFCKVQPSKNGENGKRVSIYIQRPAYTTDREKLKFSENISLTT